MKLSPKSRELYDMICLELQAHGIEQWELVPKAKHPAVKFLHDGHVRTITFPSSPSDRRGSLNARSHLRAVLRGTNQSATWGAKAAPC